MKAAIVTEAGGIPHFGEFADPVVDDSHVLVELVATAIHPLVRSLAQGRHYGSTGSYPLIPGVDAVARTSRGELVYTGYVEAPYGTFAEQMVVPGSMGFTLPDNADPVAVAASMNPGLASWMPLTKRLSETDKLGTVLVLGATGAAGLLAVQNAFTLGADHVIAVGRNASALETVAGLGASAVQLSGSREIDAAAMGGAFGETTPSLVLDFVWGPVAESAFGALSRQGLAEDVADISYIEIGALAGAEASIPASLLRSRRIRVSGSGAGSGSIADIMAQLPVYLDLIATGKAVVPAAAYPLSRVTEAWVSRSRERPVIVAD